jgi:beta-galactosidase
MHSFDVRAGQFWIDGQPVFIQAGEFHYFRTTAESWRHRLELLRQAGFNAVASYIPWLWHQPDPETCDLDGHTHPLRNLIGFIDLAADMGLWVIARPGPYIMAETINEGIPPWFFARYPEAALIGQDGKPQNIVSYLHPRFLDAAGEWYARVFAALAPRQITRGGRIILIQLDNEMGMAHWVRNLIDINPDTLARFADFLLRDGAQPLGQRRSADELRAFLRQQLIDPQPPHAARVLEEYRRFYRAYLREYAVWLWQRARAHGMEVPAVINIHGFANGGKTFPIGLSQLVDVMAFDGVISATDVYPLSLTEGNFHHILLVNAMTQALHHPQQPLFSIEFQAGGAQDFSGTSSAFYDLHARLSIACGMRGINHYLFFDGENHPLLSPVKRHDWGHPMRKDGTLRRHYARYPRLSRVLAAYGEALVRSRPVAQATIGFTLDMFMTEVNNAFTQQQTEILTHQREVILFDLLARGLALTHRPFGAVDLERRQLDPAATPTLFALIEKQCARSVQHKLVEYVRRGGRLMLIGRMCEETFDHAPCTLLRDALGIRSTDDHPPFAQTRMHALGWKDVPVSFVQTFSGDFEETIATTEDGRIIGFITSLGAGRVMMLGAAFAANTLDDLALLSQMMSRMGSEPLFTLSSWADVHLSEGEAGSFLFVNNYQDDPLETTIALRGEPLFGGHTLALPARRGAILPLDWQVRAGITLHYLTAEVTAIVEEGARLRIHTDPPVFHAELSLAEGWRPADHAPGQVSAAGRIRLTSSAGVIELVRGS